MRRGLESMYFDSCEVKGDKITIHKCVIDKAIKNIENDPDPFGDSERRAGKIDILEDMLDVIDMYKNIQAERKLKKDGNKERK